jgi:hypothetical protein
MAEHLITPPPELVDEWRRVPEYTDGLRKLTMVTITVDRLQYIATQAARWGADQQLAKDAEWLDYNTLDEPHLRITPMGESLKEAMRPRPPSLKEQALEVLGNVQKGWGLAEVDLDTIRLALEQLND